MNLLSAKQPTRIPLNLTFGFKRFPYFSDYNSKLFSLNKNRRIPIVTIPISFLRGFILSLTTIIFLNESPIALSENDFGELKDLALKNDLILMDSIKTAYSTAYNRLLLLLKGGKIGDIYSIDATCTSLKDFNNSWNSITSWGPTALLPIFQLFGTDYLNKEIISLLDDEKNDFDLFTKINFQYENAVASIKVGTGVKSEGELIISGTDGYGYVPSPWWKTDYFELRFEN